MGHWTLGRSLDKVPWQNPSQKLGSFNLCSHTSRNEELTTSRRAVGAAYSALVSGPAPKLAISAQDVKCQGLIQNFLVVSVMVKEKVWPVPYSFIQSFITTWHLFQTRAHPGFVIHRVNWSIRSWAPAAPMLQGGRYRNIISIQRDKFYANNDF